MSYSNVLILCLVLLGSVAAIYGKDVSEKDLRKNYAKLNKHLEKNVKSDHPKTNMAEIKRLLDEKPSGWFTFDDVSYTETLKKLVEFSSLQTNPNVCKIKKKTELAEFIDSGLADKKRKTDTNYPLTRLDRIVEYYADALPHLCAHDKNHPKMEYAYKRVAYDEINKLLEAKLPGDDNIDRNMLKAEELLEGLTSDGALAQALRQFLKLKSTLRAENCNELGYAILFRNDLATRRNGHSGHDKPARRVDRIYQQYARKHEQFCRPVMLATFKRMVRRFSPDTYRKVLGLICTAYVESSELPKLVSSLERKDIDEKFFTPSLLEPVWAKIEDYPDNKSFDFAHLFDETIKVDRILEYLRILSQDDPLAEYLGQVEIEKGGELVIDQKGLKRLINNYLYQPCDQFLSMFGDLVRADDFNTAINIHHIETTKKKMLEELTYHTIRVGYKICIYVKYKLQESMTEVIREQLTYDTPQHYTHLLDW